MPEEELNQNEELDQDVTEELESTVEVDAESDPLPEVTDVSDEAQAADVDEPLVDDGETDSEPEDLGGFDEALVRHAENYGLDKDDFPNAQAMRKALNAITRRELEASRSRPDDNKTQPKTPTDFPTATDDFDLGLPEDFDPELRPVIEKMNSHYKAKFDAQNQMVQQAQQFVQQMQHQQAVQLFNGWMETNGHTDLSQPELENVWTDANALANSYQARGLTVHPHEIIRRAFVANYPDRVDRATRDANKETKRQERKRQTTTPPNTRARAGKNGAHASWRDMPEGDERMQAYIDDFMSSRGG